VAKNEAIKGDIRKVNNGKKDVDSILLKPIQVDKANLDSTVIKDGFHKKDDVYKNVKKA
jgi:D-xylose transport system substrate-binding protein